MWNGGLEPFGKDWQEGTANDMLTKGIFLRFPGQWDEAVFANASLGADVYYNVHRWYEPGTGTYSSADPLGQVAGRNEYQYVKGSPLRWLDALGLKINHVDQTLKGFVACARGVGGTEFQQAWNFFEQREDLWDFRWQDGGTSFQRKCIRKAPEGERSCTQRPNDGGFYPWELFNRGTFWIEPEDMGPCVEIVDNIVHEMMEAHRSYARNEAGATAHDYVTGPARDEAKRICAQCCPLIRRSN